MLGGAAQDLPFATIDHRTSCTPYQDCDTYERSYKKKYRDDDGEKRTKIVERTYRDCDDLWRCQSERRYEVEVDDRCAARRRARCRKACRSSSAGTAAARAGIADTLELPAAYLQGYLLAVDGYPHTPRPAPAPPEPRLSSP